MDQEIELSIMRGASLVRFAAHSSSEPETRKDWADVAMYASEQAGANEQELIWLWETLEEARRTTACVAPLIANDVEDDLPTLRQIRTGIELYRSALDEE